MDEARSKASSIQQSVSKALTGNPEEGFTMGVRAPTPSYAPKPRCMQFLQSGAAHDRLFIVHAVSSHAADSESCEARDARMLRF